MRPSTGSKITRNCCRHFSSFTHTQKVFIPFVRRQLNSKNKAPSEQNATLFRLFVDSTLQKLPSDYFFCTQKGSFTGEETFQCAFPFPLFMVSNGWGWMWIEKVVDCVELNIAMGYTREKGTWCSPSVHHPWAKLNGFMCSEICAQPHPLGFWFSSPKEPVSIGRSRFGHSVGTSFH